MRWLALPLLPLDRCPQFHIVHTLVLPTADQLHCATLTCLGQSTACQITDDAALCWRLHEPKNIFLRNAEALKLRVKRGVTAVGAYPLGHCEVALHGIDCVTDTNARSWRF